MSQIQSKKQLLSGWGNYPRKECDVYRPEKCLDIAQVISGGNTVIGRGAGMSYGDAALGVDSVLDMSRLNRFLQFDKKKGTLCVEAGATLADILAVIVPQGWFFPVIPGTKYATIGGAVACNVHGKNHFESGELAEHVISLELRTANGKLLTCSPQEQSEIFWATTGGMGMTGVIETVTIKLKHIRSQILEVETKQTSDLAEMIALMRHHAKDSEYMVGWIDHFAGSERLGEGVFEKAKHVNNAKDGDVKQYRVCGQRISVPIYLPPFVLNKYMMALYNRQRFAKYSADFKQESVNFEGFFHPLDSIANWNRLYGKRGFLQYQCLVPEGKQAEEQIKTILERIHKHGSFSFLAVLKYHGKESKAMLSFSKPGFSLALDFQNTPQIRQLLRELNDYIAEIGGRVYLAKDAVLSAEQFDKIYADSLPKWRKVVKKLNPNSTFYSMMAQRLQF